MDDELEPVVRLELSIFEAWAIHTFLVQNEAEVMHGMRHAAMSGEGHGGYKQPLLTTQRALAKVKTGIDAALLECKRRYRQQAVAEPRISCSQCVRANGCEFGRCEKGLNEELRWHR